MARRCFFMIIILGAMLDLRAQYGPHSLELHLTGGYSTYSFRQDSLVIPHRRGSSGLGSDVNVTLEYQFHFIEQRLALKAGLGFSTKEIQMDKYGLSDLFAIVIPFYPFEPDTSYLYGVDLRGKYLVIPLSVYYRLSRNINHAVQFFVGMQMNSSIRLSTHSLVTFDHNYFSGSSQPERVVAKKYQDNLQSFLVSISPKLDMRIRCYRGLGIIFNLFPVSFYCNSWTKSLTSAGSNFNGSLGIYYSFR